MHAHSSYVLACLISSAHDSMPRGMRHAPACMPHPDPLPPGPSGASVREIMWRSGADIKSWTEARPVPGGGGRPARVFLIGVGGQGWRNG
jgi:hypothetical protein